MEKLPLSIIRIGKKCTVLVFALSNLSLNGSSSLNERQVIASVLCAEAASEGKIGILAVAEVIYTRTQAYSVSPLSVVLKKGAFTCLAKSTPSKLYTRWSKTKMYPVALGVSLTLCREPSKLTRMTNRATHYTRKEEKPYWSKGRRPVATIGAHAFYRLP